MVQNRFINNNRILNDLTINDEPLSMDNVHGYMRSMINYSNDLIDAWNNIYGSYYVYVLDGRNWKNYTDNEYDINTMVKLFELSEYIDSFMNFGPDEFLIFSRYDITNNILDIGKELITSDRGINGVKFKVENGDFKYDDKDFIFFCIGCVRYLKEVLRDMDIENENKGGVIYNANIDIKTI